MFEAAAEPELRVVEVHEAFHVPEGQVLHLEAGPVKTEIVELCDVLLQSDKETVFLWETN